MACRDIVSRLFLLFVLSRTALCIEDDCSINTYNSSDGYMQFTKETTFAEFAIVGKFKGLHCCAKGYRSVEWLKDGRLYPWSSSVSGLILYPESANQTIYTQTITAEDAGNYTCLLRNDTTVYTHTIQLRVFDKIPDDPKITYVSNDKEVSVGQSVRLFCEAFVGVVNLPDAHSEAIWTKSGHNGSIDDEPRIRQEKVSREDGQTFGTYLIIEEVVNDDFGKYICKIVKPGRAIDLPVYIREKVYVGYLNPNPVPWKKLIITVAIILVFFISAFILYVHFGLSLRVKFKDRFGALEDNDDKTSDVLILHSQQDSEMALEKICPLLENEYHYKCTTKTLPSGVNLWCAKLSDAARKTRRVVAVISPTSLDNQWDTATVYQALKQLNSLNAKLVCVAMQELPKSGTDLKNAQGETLASILKSMTVIPYSSERFWLSLRLHLPAKRFEQASNDIDMTQTNNPNDTRLNRFAEPRSLDMLV